MKNNFPVEEELVGMWLVKDDNGTYLSLERAKPDLDDEDWMEIPSSTHLQLALCEDDPYWKNDVREINDRPWWYRKRFSVSEDHRGKLVRLRFEGVDYYSDIWLNGDYLGHHEGNFAPFQFDVTNKLNYNGENLIAVKVEAPWDAPYTLNPFRRLYGTIKNMAKGLYQHPDGLFPPNVNPTGIWRPVKLISSGFVTIDHIKVKTENLEPDSSKISASMTFTNHNVSPKSVGVEVRIEGESLEGVVYEEKWKETLNHGVQQIGKTSTIENPRLWWPWDHGSPELYELRVRLLSEDGEVSDTHSVIFGIRTVDLVRSREKMYFTINGRRIFIRGSTYIPDVYLSRMSYEKYAEDLRLIKECNMNLLRLHVHVERPELYDLCDRMGIMIYQDFELNWVHPSSSEWEKRIIPIFGDMIHLLENHPSIVAWCCHNEPSKTNYVEHPDSKLYEEALFLDDRPVFKGSGIEKDYLHSGDSHTYCGSISARLERYQDVYMTRERFNSEYGVDAPPSLSSMKEQSQLYNRLSHIHDKISQLQYYQSCLIKYYAEHYRRSKYNPCGGCIQFMFVDCTPSTFYGVLDYGRNEKSGYQTLKEAFQPLLICFEYHGDEPKGVWIINDLHKDIPECQARWEVANSKGKIVVKGERKVDIRANSSEKIINLIWDVEKAESYDLELLLVDKTGEIISRNSYHSIFHPPSRPPGYPNIFDKYLGVRRWM